ncbi:Uncharacterised protein [uncultured archaeon]|nr:Uncharacterised protein [uncultured archaeon]
MSTKVFFHGKQVIIRTTSLDWGDVDKIMDSELFGKIVGSLMHKLREKNSDFLKILPKVPEKKQEELILLVLKRLAKDDRETVMKTNPELKPFFEDTYLLDRFVEELYNYWRGHERYLICVSDPKSKNGVEIDKKPYRTFNDTIEKLNHTVRKIYRDIQENITGEHPMIFRQVPAGCTVGAIAKEMQVKLPKEYGQLKRIPVIRQVLLNPPILIDPTINKRKGQFALVGSNPLEGIGFDNDEWLCFPAKVGSLVIYLYFNNFYTGLAISTSNLFELCTEEDLKKQPDGIYAFGVSHETLQKFAPEKTVFYSDEKNGMMVGAVPADREYGFFGYVKKMMLTLHNAIMIRRGRMPVHGAMVRITMKTGEKSNVVLVGDSGAGKSESIEAFRVLSGDNLRELKVVFDDMGCLELTKEGKIKAYGTETGAFVRIDDLESGYVYGQMDRMIIMIPHKEPNARVLVPITTLKEVLHGWPVDYFLYANNYAKPEGGIYIERFKNPEDAMAVFKEGKRLAKGTTHEIGLTTSYYANIFGPSQMMKEHELIADRFFRAMFREGIFVGQVKTQLGLAGMEQEGPQQAARALFREITEKKQGKGKQN